MYACGVTIAGLMNLKKKNPPIKEQMEASVASGYFLYLVSSTPLDDTIINAPWSMT
jgi:hypothetical protein